MSAVRHFRIIEIGITYIGNGIVIAQNRVKTDDVKTDHLHNK